MSNQQLLHAARTEHDSSERANWLVFAIVFAAVVTVFALASFV